MNIYKYTGDEKVHIEFENIVESIVENVSNCRTYSLTNGISGIGWLFYYFVKQDAISEGGDYFLNIIDEYLINNLDDIQSEGYFDFMHGVLGVAYYFIKRKKFDYVRQVILNLLDNAEQTMNGLYWSSNSESSNGKDKIINLSLAHGSASIIVLLSKMLNTNSPTLENLKLKSTIEKVIAFVSYRKEYEKSEFYPAMCELDDKGDIVNKYTRLSWCYGDMGIGLSFWQAGQALGDSTLKKEAINIYINTTKRRYPEESGVIDSCFCHGTAGLAHMYNRMYYNTGISEFRQASSYWIRETIKMAKFEGGAAGYKTWNVDRWTNENNLLMGTSGIGLCLLSHLSKEFSKWDECFLLS